MNLQRTTRDRLLLVAVVAWICAQHAFHLPFWSGIGCGVLLAWCAHRIWRAAGRPLRVPRWGLLLGLAAVTAATLLNYHTLFGKEAGVTFLLMLLCLKTFETTTRRDIFTVFFLGFFAQLCNLLFSQSLVSALGMVVGVLGLLVVLINAHMPAGRPALTHLLRTAALLVAWGAPVMLALFMLFPRLPPLWGLPTATPQGHSGLGRDMRVGNIAELALDTSIALRVRFQDTMPTPQEMYFRGPVLTHFDGRRWTQDNVPVLAHPAQSIAVSGSPVRYQVTLQANQSPWLLVLDAAAEAPAISAYTAALRADLQWMVNRPINNMVRYQASSYVNFRYGLDANQAELRAALALPARHDPRTLAWAQTLRHDPNNAHADAKTLMLAVLLQLRSGGYQYTLSPGLYGDDIADTFWFDRKAGFCEHIASAFVIAMRALQIPARVVTGYQGGERNPVDGVWTVRQSDAHAWAEVWLPGQGWTRVDPTAILAPERAQARGRLREPPGFVSDAIFSVSPGFLDTTRSAWEALNSRWNQWVLNYTEDKQQDLLRQLGFQTPNWQTLVQLLATGMAGMALVSALWIRWSQARTDPWLRLLTAAHKRLQKGGWVAAATPPATLPPPGALVEALKRHVATTPGNARDALHIAGIIDWLQRLERWRYAAPAQGRLGQRAALAKLGREFHRKRWPPRTPNDPRAP